MQITMKTLYSCPKFTAHPGDTIDIDAKIARQLIERRFAVRAAADPATSRRPARHPEPDPDEGDPNAGGDVDEAGSDNGGGDGEGQGDGVEPTPVDDPPADSPVDPEPADVKPPKRTRKGGK